MARVHPPLGNIRRLSHGEHVELAMLRSLDEALPQCFELFHSEDWTQAQSTGDSHGELGIVVVNRSGDLAILQVKSGPLSYSAEGLGKRRLDQVITLDAIFANCWCGLERSSLLSLDQLGDRTVWCFSGHDNAIAQPLGLDCGLLINTLRRMKGQSAAASMLPKVDFEELGRLRWNKLFTCVTGAGVWLKSRVSDRVSNLAVVSLATSLVLNEC